MATTIQPPEIQRHDASANGGRGGGGVNNTGPAPGNPIALDQFLPEPSRTGIWVGLAAITMSFAAFTSALVVRQATANDWHPLTIPSIVFVNTAILLASSVTLQIARHRVADFAQGRTADRAASLVWLGVTLGLGVIFVVGQFLAWRQLRAEGFYLASNPNSSFFYVLTAMHAVHVLGGLAGLARVIYLLRQPGLCLRRSTLDATSYYWHFMGVLWLYVLIVMWSKL